MVTATHRIPGLVLTDHRFTVPLDYGAPIGPTIEVYAREVTAPRASDDLPYLVFFQGGPGFASPRPNEATGWVGRAIRDYRVLLLDQRGTGRSTPVLPETLARIGSPQDQAEYLQHFRADNIIRDAELIRGELIGDATWSVLGQSFGGFCVTRYLSAAPEGLREAFITGGLPPIGGHPDDFYRLTHQRMLDRNARYYERYPDDRDLVRRIAALLDDGRGVLPDGMPLTVRRFQQLGMLLGMGEGFEQLHYGMEEAFVTGDDALSSPFLRHVFEAQLWETNPIFSLIHEACVCDGTASRWSANRLRREFPQFDDPSNLTAEAIYPWIFEDYPLLCPFAETAEILANVEWPHLYDPQVLAANTVPAAAAVYYDDMYVERIHSEATADAIAGMRIWVTNQYQHNGLRTDGANVLDHLIAMVRGER
jgi:pimeloyl-ACP methyl ester carboxylesterase